MVSLHCYCRAVIQQRGSTIWADVFGLICLGLSHCAECLQGAALAYSWIPCLMSAILPHSAHPPQAPRAPQA